MITALLVAVMLSGESYAATVSVSGPSALPGALDTAAAGDTLLLAAGDYGSVTVRNADTGFVTIASADGMHGAVFATLTLDAAAYVRVDGVRARVIMPTDSCRHIDILNCNAGGEAGEYDAIAAIRASAGVFSDFRIEGNRMRNAVNGSQMFNVTNLTFRDNVADSVRGDSYKFADITDGLIENNWGAAYYVEDSLAHHDFMQWQGGLSKDVIIRGNINLVGPDGSGSQGIFGGNPTYENLLIENNIIYCGSANAIYVSAGTLITVRSNTVLTFPGVLKSVISVPDGAVKENNIQAHRATNAGTDTSGNYTIQHQDSTAEFYYNDFYQNAMVGRGCTIEDLRPVPGSPADGQAGAYERIYELLGTSSVAQPPELINTFVTMEDGVLFDLQGRMVPEAAHGVYLRYDGAAGRLVKVIYIQK